MIKKVLTGFARHVYANPKDPVVCPFLAMPNIVFTEDYRRSGTSWSVFGLSAKGRYEDVNQKQGYSVIRAD